MIHMAKPNTSSERASVLIVAVGVLVALTLMAVTFTTLTRLELAASRNMDDVMTTRLLARAGLEYAIHVLRVDKFGSDNDRYNGSDLTSSPWVVEGSDENYDSYYEEWMPGGGWFSKSNDTGPYTAATTGTGVPDPDENNVDSDGYTAPAYSGSGGGGYDSVWLDFPFDLPDGRKAQVAILIKDFGASRLNINYTWNNDDWSGSYAASNGMYVYHKGRYTTDAVTATATGGINGLNSAVAMAIVRARHGDTDKQPGLGGTDSALYYPLNPSADDRPFSVLTAEELIMKPFMGYVESPLRSIFTTWGSSLTADRAQYLTPWSFDTLWPPFVTSAGANRLKSSVNTLTAAQLADFPTIYSSWWSDVPGEIRTRWEQFAVNLVDYRDTNTDIISHPVGTPTYYGIEPHLLISELYAANEGVYRIEFFNPFGEAVTLSDYALNVEFEFDFEQDASTTTSYPIHRTLSGVVDLSTYTSNRIEPSSYLVVGNNGTNGDVSAADIDLDGKVTWTVNPTKRNPLDAGSQDFLSGTDFTGSKFKVYFDTAKVTLKRLASPQVVVDEANPSDSADAFPGPPDGSAKTKQRERLNIEESDNWKTWNSNQHTLKAANKNARSTITLAVVQNEIYSLGQLGDIALVGSDLTSSYTKDADWIDACKDLTDQAKLDKVLFNPHKVATGTTAFFQFFESLTTEDPEANGADDDADGSTDRSTDTGSQAGDIGGREVQIPGRININTASAKVLSYLPAYLDPSTGNWQTLGELTAGGSTTLAKAIVDHRETITNGPFRGIGDILKVSEIADFAGTGSRNNNDDDNDGIEDDEREEALIFRSIANMITVRTNVFAVYITARIIPEPGEAFGADGLDNDGDGQIDEDDEGRYRPGTDKRDNDGDGLIDEADEATLASWDPGQDSVDNDGDTLVDEADESDVGRWTGGNDGIDNDQDGATDEDDEDTRSVEEIGRQKLIAVVDRSTDPITVRVFRWTEE